MSGLPVPQSAIPEAGLVPAVGTVAGVRPAALVAVRGFGRREAQARLELAGIALKKAVRKARNRRLGGWLLWAGALERRTLGSGEGRLLRTAHDRHVSAVVYFGESRLESVAGRGSGG